MVYAFITYLLAFSGIGTFYYNFNSGSLIKSRLLCYYKWIINMIFIIITACVTPGFFRPFLIIQMQSQLTTNFIYGFRFNVLLMIVSSVYCAHRWQYQLFKLLDRLLKMEKITVQPNYYSERAEHCNLMPILFMRILIFVMKPIIVVFWVFEGKRHYTFYLFAFLKNIFCGTISLLNFTLLWLVCRLFHKLLFNLDQLLVDPMAMPEQFKKIVRIQRMFSQLIHIINQICILFEYPVLSSILYILGQSCLSGYLIARMCSGSVNTYAAISLIIQIAMFTFSDLLDFLFLASIGEAAGKLQEKTFLILRNPSTNVKLVERSVSNIVYNIGLLSSYFSFRWIGSPYNNHGMARTFA